MAAPINPPRTSEIAAGNVDRTGASPGDNLQGAQGCSVIAGTTGLIQVTISPPNDGVASTDLVVLYNCGFGMAKGGGGITANLSTLSAGVFLFELFDQTVVPPVLIDGSVHFKIYRKYPNR